MKVITVESGQNIIDIAQQEYGTPEGLVTICDDNGLEYDADLLPGQSLNIRESGVDDIPYFKITVVTQYAGAVINSQTNRKTNDAAPDVLPAFYGAGVVGLDADGIKALNVVYKNTKVALLQFVANMQRLYYAWPNAQGSISHAYQPGGYDAISSFDISTITLSIAGTDVLYNVACLKNDTYLTDDDNFKIDFE